MWLPLTDCDIPGTTLLTGFIFRLIKEQQPLFSEWYVAFSQDCEDLKSGFWTCKRSVTVCRFDSIPEIGSGTQILHKKLSLCSICKHERVRMSHFLWSMHTEWLKSLFENFTKRWGVRSVWRRILCLWVQLQCCWSFGCNVRSQVGNRGMAAAVYRMKESLVCQIYYCCYYYLVYPLIFLTSCICDVSRAAMVITRYLNRFFIF